MEQEETAEGPHATGGYNLSCKTPTTYEDVVEEQLKNGQRNYLFQHDNRSEIESNPESNSMDFNSKEVEEEYYHYNQGSLSNHDGYKDTYTTDSPDSSNGGGNLTSGHSPSSYYDPSGILYEINHTYVVSSLEPIPENQVLSTISEETYQEPSSSSSYDGESGNSYGNSEEEEVFYTEEVPESGYSSPPTYATDGDSYPSRQGYQRDNAKETSETHSKWEQGLKSEPDPSIQTGNFSQELLQEEQFQPISLKIKKSNETSNEDENKVEGSYVSPYTATTEHSFSSSTKPNQFPEQFDGRPSTEIHSFSALDHSGHFRRPSIPDSIRDHDKRLSRNISFNVTEKEIPLQIEQGGVTKIDLPDQRNSSKPKKLPSPTKPGHPDIDGGWAWVVVGCCFCSFIILLGLLFTCSLYYAAMLTEFGHSRSYTAWVGSLVNSFFMLGSLASSTFIQKFGCRAATILGSLIMTSGYIMSAFATSLEMIFATYGVFVASGMNLVFSAAILVLAQYFHKRHCLATTIAMVGTGVGIFVMVLEMVIEEYGWRISYLFCAAIALQLCICGSLLFPLPSSALQSTLEENGSLGENEEENGRRGDEDIENQRFASDSSESEDEYHVGPKAGTGRRRRGLRRRTSTGNKTLYYQKDLLNKSFSSLMLSAQAGYLSHSLASLSSRTPSMLTFHHHHHDDASQDPRRHAGHHSRVSSRHHLHDNLSRHTLSRNESFASRMSSIMPSFLRSSQLSFSSKLSSAQVSISGIRSGQTSKLSLKDSRLDLFLHGIKSNPHSFSLRHPYGDQQREETEQLCGKLDDLMEEDRSGSEEGLKEKEVHLRSPCSGTAKKWDVSRRGGSCCEKGTCSTGAADGDCGVPTVVCEDRQDENKHMHRHREEEKKASFLISGGESEEEEEDVRSTDSDEDFLEDGNLCYECVRCRIENLKQSIGSVRFEPDPVLKDPGLWCFAFAYFFCLLGSITMYVIFKDFATHKGLGDVSSMALSAAGIGDLIGRIGGGLLAASKIGNCVLLYSLSMTLSAVVLGLLMVVNDATMFVITTTVFGILSGSQNIYIAVTPNELFGREKLARVFGISVFLAGIGALIGSPFAGYVVDQSGGYLAVIIIEMFCSLIGSGLIFLCYVLNRLKKGKASQEPVNTETSLNEKRQNQIKTRITDSDREDRLPSKSEDRGRDSKDSTDSQILRNMKLVRLSLMEVNEGNLKYDDVILPSQLSPHVHRSRQMTHHHPNHDLKLLQGHRNKLYQQPSSSLKTAATHTSLLSLQPSRPRCGSYPRPNNQILKRTSTCDSILHNSLRNDTVGNESSLNTSVSSQTPALNHTPELERRYSIGTASTVTKPVSKKKATSLYEEVLGKKMMLQIVQMETQSDQNLSCVRGGEGVTRI